MSLSIPNTAPFSGAQKMWLKGYLDAINCALASNSSEGSTPATTSLVPVGLPITILWGSQTGNSEALGKKISKVLGAKGHTPTLRSMEEVSPADLATSRNVLIITSTYGDGEPPDNAAALYTALHAPDAPSLSTINFSVLALGDSNYPDFCKCGRDFHTRLTALGATPLTPIIEADVDYDEPFANWIKALDIALVAA